MLSKDQLDALRGHTPRPWFVVDGDTAAEMQPVCYIGLVGDTHIWIAQDHSQMHDGTPEVDADLLAAAPDLLAHIDEQQAEIDRLRDRDGNAGIELNYETPEFPFHRRELEIVDFSVSENQYVVTDPVGQAEIDKLRQHAESLAKALDNIEVMVEDEETEIRWTAKNALDVYFAAYPREGT